MAQGLEQYRENTVVALKRVVIIATISILLIGAVVFIIENAKLRNFIEGLSWFHIQDVVIEGGDSKNRAFANATTSSLNGKSLLLVDTQEIATQLRKDVWLDSVSVKKSFPDRLIVHLSQRTPRALLLKGDQLFYLDVSGKEIEGISDRIPVSDLPLVTFSVSSSLWDSAFPIQVLAAMEKQIPAAHKVSQIVLGTPPFFKVFLEAPPVEVLLHVETWKSQIPNLRQILSDPPGQTGEIHRINLVLPKKAVVSSILSN